MSELQPVTKETRFPVNAQTVWAALTEPDLTEAYFFGCRAESDWKPGSALVFTANLNGQATPVVKGVVLEASPHTRLVHSCFTPENEANPGEHTVVTYELTAEGGSTTLSVVQSGFSDPIKREETEASWDQVLAALKAILEAAASS